MEGSVLWQKGSSSCEKPIMRYALQRRRSNHLLPTQTKLMIGAIYIHIRSKPDFMGDGLWISPICRTVGIAWSKDQTINRFLKFSLCILCWKVLACIVLTSKRLACYFEIFGVRRAFHACFGVRRQFCHGEAPASACNPVNFWRAFPENAQRWRANEVTLHPGSSQPILRC